MNHNKLMTAMIHYFAGDPKRIQHFVKVYQFAKIIGEEEKLDDQTQAILETAALVHDIGIKRAEQKYGACNGKLQEQEGPPEAEKMLSELHYEEALVWRVSYLVGHHHTYTEVDGIDYRILLEADFLVNLYEDSADEETVRHAYDVIFRTETGRQLCRAMYLSQERTRIYDGKGKMEESRQKGSSHAACGGAVCRVRDAGKEA